jgi:hypothetical protein
MTKHTGSDGSVVTYTVGFEMNLLNVVLQVMNMTFFHVRTLEGFEMKETLTINKLFDGMLGKEIDIALGGMGTLYLKHPNFDPTNMGRTALLPLRRKSC